VNVRLSPRSVVTIAVLVLAAAVGVASYFQRNAARSASAQAQTAQTLLTAMLDQETGVRGLAITDDERFLDPYRNGRREYESAFARARRQVASERAAREILVEADASARAWMALAEEEIRLLRAGARDRALAAGPMESRKARMDRFRFLNRRYATAISAEGERLETRAIYGSIALVVGLGAAFAIGGLLLARHVARIGTARRARERAFDGRQRDLAVGLQVTESEQEAHAFLQRHLERSIEDSEVVVLTRNNSANRLRAGTPVAADSKLGRLDDLEPRSCMSIRLAQQRSQVADGTDSILQCGVCGRMDTRTTCSPLLVGGEVIGSVLVGHPAELDPFDARAIDESVKQAAPVLANLRNLAIAENRAATDGLTGLPNRRAFEETLKRMIAHSNRQMSPMAAVALDLDHFKTINDVHGHARGDEVLAEVGALLKSLLRDSDFVSRIGGEEFMLLLPDTGRDGALVISERVRSAIAALDFPSLDRDVTASIGVATLPDDATDAPNLIRAADRMLYAAKDLGRNRVEITAMALEPVPDGLEPVT
jgi:diguanylate cyclase (GGDEF)-like protein